VFGNRTFLQSWPPPMCVGLKFSFSAVSPAWQRLFPASPRHS
jgi:hypothetical protein